MVFVASGANNGGAPPLDAVHLGPPWVTQRPPGWAFYDAPGHGLGAYLFVHTSEGTQQVRVLYSTAARGSAPEWVECGHAPVEFNDDYQNNFWAATPRCVLATGDSPRDVTALAAVASSTPPPAAPDPAQDAGSDASAGYQSYRSRPSEVSLGWEGPALDPTRCHLLRVRSADQRGVPLWHANVDLHLRAPAASASFAAGHYAEDATQAPNDSHQAPAEDGLSCGEGVAPPRQTRHTKEGLEIWHIESAPAGTDHFGDFSVPAWVKEQPATSVFAWVDQNDDDVWQRSEPSDVLLYREDTTIEPELSTTKEDGGVEVVVGGELDGAMGCSIQRPANVQRRRSRAAPWRHTGKTFVGGRYNLHWEVIQRTTWFRLIAPPLDFPLPCKRATSPAVRVRVPG